MNLIPGLIRNKALLQGQVELLQGNGKKRLQAFLSTNEGVELTLDLHYDRTDKESPFVWIITPEVAGQPLDDDLVVSYQDFPFIIHILRANGTLAKAFEIIKEDRILEMQVARDLLLGAPREISVGLTHGLSCGDEVKIES